MLLSPAPRIGNKGVCGTTPATPGLLIRGLQSNKIDMEGPAGIRCSISNRKLCCFSYIIAMVHQNSPTVDKIEGNLRRANTELSVDFRRANTEPSVDLRKANTEPSVHFRRANTETYQK